MSEHECDDPKCRYCRLTLRPPTQECEDYQRDNSFERQSTTDAIVDTYNGICYVLCGSYHDNTGFRVLGVYDRLAVVQDRVKLLNGADTALRVTFVKMKRNEANPSVPLW